MHYKRRCQLNKQNLLSKNNIAHGNRLPKVKFKNSLTIYSQIESEFLKTSYY